MCKHESLTERNWSGKAGFYDAVHLRQQVLTRTKEELAIYGERIIRTIRLIRGQKIIINFKLSARPLDAFTKASAD